MRKLLRQLLIAVAVVLTLLTALVAGVLLTPIGSATRADRFHDRARQ
jgi:hypothetical protein